MNFLKGMYVAHGAQAELKEDWAIIDGGRLQARAAYFIQGEYPQGVALQADFITLLPSGHHIVESFAGMGRDLNHALQDACSSFQDSTFHALSSAFLGSPSDQVEVVDLEIDAIPRVVTFGGVRIRGELPADFWPPVFSALEAQLKISELPCGLHWVRYFYSNLPPDPPTIEVLLDNATWTEQEKKITQLPWPVSTDFYSVRLFFIIQDR